MDEETKNKPGFIKALWDWWKSSNPGVKPPDVYHKMEITKQNFFGQINKGREVSPKNWKAWRIGLGITKAQLWKKAQEFYDP